MRSLLLLTVLATSIFGADHAGPDPYKTMNSMANLQVLSRCTEQLNTNGMNAEVLSTAMMAYVNLALDDDMRPQGDRGGRWRAAARQLQTELAALPDQATADPRPAVWLDLLDGRCKKAIDDLEQLGMQDTPHGRAIRAFATADYRIVDNKPGPLSAHEHYALGYAYLRNQLDDALLAMADRNDLPPIGWAWITLKNKSDRDRYALQLKRIRHVFGNLPLMLSTSQIDDATALAAGNPILAALNLPPAGNRNDLLSRLQTALSKERAFDGQLFTAAWLACDPVRNTDIAIQNEDGNWRLANSAILACKVRADLYACAWDWHHMAIFHRGENAAKRISEPILAQDYGMLSAIVRAYTTHQTPSADTLAALQRAIEQEVNDERGLPLAVITNLLQSPRTPEPKRKKLLSIIAAASKKESSQSFSRIPSAVIYIAQRHITKSPNLIGNEYVNRAIEEDPWSTFWDLKRAMAWGTDIPTAKELVKRLPWRTDLLATIGEHAWKEKNLEEARDAYQQAVNLSSGSSTNQASLGILLFQLNQTEESAQVFRTLLANPIANGYAKADAKRYLGMIAIQNGDDSTAREQLEQAAQTGDILSVTTLLEFQLDHQEWSKARSTCAQFPIRQEYRDIPLALVNLLDPSSNNDDALKKLAAIDIRRLRDPHFSLLFGLYSRFGQLQAWDSGLSPDLNTASEPMRLASLFLNTELCHFGRAHEAAVLLADRKVYDDLHERLKKPSTGNALPSISDRNRTYALIYRHQLARLLGKPGNNEQAWWVLKPLEGGGDRAFIIECLRGNITRETALEQAASAKDGDEIYYWLALEDLACGRIDQTRQQLQSLIATHPQWRESQQARGILKWIDSWDEATAARFAAGIQKKSCVITEADQAKQSDLDF